MTSVSAALKGKRSWVWSHRLRIIFLCIVLILTAPWPARGQALSPCCVILSAGLSSIANSLKTIASSLNAILGVDKGMLQFEQTVVWPTTAITQAQALVGSQQGLFTRIQTLLHIPVNILNNWRRSFFPAIQVKSAKHRRITPLCTGQSRRQQMRHRKSGTSSI
jgi:hypothetical protein